MNVTLLISDLGENSEDLHEYDHYLRNWGVRDLFESPLLDSAMEHVRQHFYQLFYDQRREKSAPQYTAGFSLHRSPRNHCHTHKCTFIMIPLVSPLDSSDVCDMLCACVQLALSAHAAVIVGAVVEIVVGCHRHHADDSAQSWRRASGDIPSPTCPIRTRRFQRLSLGDPCIDACRAQMGHNR